MLRISKKADYAVFLLGAIAREGAYPGGAAEDGVVSAQEIAKRANLNKSVVANLLKDFARNGILESVRGLKGGYRLAVPPREVSLHQILEVVEGKFTLVECIAHGTAGGGAAGGTTAGGAPASGSPHAHGTASLLPLAASQRREPAEEAGSCSLYAFCPSKRPMHVVHDRIRKLFDDIRLDELCNLEAPAPALGAVANTRTAR